MDSSALASSIKSLERSLDSLGGCLLFWTAVVVLGLVVEYLPEAIKLAKERPFHWSALNPLVGGILITAGVAGELVVGFRASSVETELRAKNTEAFAGFNNEAADARRDAGDAIERATRLEKQLEDERNARVKVEFDTSGNAKQTALLRNDTARARKAAEDERLARVKIEERIAWRRLTDEQRSALVDALRLARVKGAVEIESVMGDAEGYAFATALVDVLKAAEWPAAGVNQAVFGGKLPVGVVAVVHPDTRPPLHAGALQAAFRAARFPLPGTANPEVPEGMVLILVGIKPQ